ncbi:MAG: hypothetical protein HYY84_04770 [Deltaproteobacteria bacterium]|nr:hypothetical protein [Deltaproteobacteria bacterium]
MPEPTRNVCLDKLVSRATATPNGQLAELDARIREFEARYEMTSAKMRAAFKKGAIADTSDIAKWLLLLDIRDRVGK